jgi:DNA-binding CsgD family transcriptional regulator
MYVPLETLRRAMQLAGDLADLDDPAGFPGVVLPALAAMVGCDSLTYNELGPAPGQTRYADQPQHALDPATQPVFAAYVHEHPLVNHYRDTGDGEPVKISDFLSRERFHRLGLYAEFFRPIPVEHQIAVSLPSPDGTVIGIALNRTRPDFSEADRALLSVLRAPLIHAMVRARRRNQASRALAGPIGGGPAGLTGREIEVLDLAALGRTNLAIAHALGISPRTVAKHLEHIYRKLSVTSRTAAVTRTLTPDAHVAE